MEFILTDNIKTDLVKVDIEFEKSLRPWWEELRLFLPAPGQEPGYDLLPAMVINAYRWAGNGHRLTIQMANLFRIINLASLIHLRVKDVEEGQEHNQEMQFAILIGDYIYGRVLKLLGETEADKLLDQFAVMIARINEGMVMKYKLDSGLDEYLSRGRAPFYANAFSSAARMQDWDPPHVALYEAVGQNLGLALEMIYVYKQPDMGYRYLRQAELGYQQLVQDGFFRSDALDDTIRAIWNDKEVAANAYESGRPPARMTGGYIHE